IVQELEAGSVDLNVGIKKFEEGVKLYKECKKLLDSAEKKIAVLTDGLKEDLKEDL
ncbi:exodeoxyribonuclease VII small subunit, partial [Candidatus Peregrinibacteria bacterium]|nr:exodeoxyribonuclease VII small subunit [Candidatus Peregrinibacteria bacterium]